MRGSFSRPVLMLAAALPLVSALGCADSPDDVAGPHSQVGLASSPHPPIANLCASSCADLGFSCGLVPTGCGTTLNCGKCLEGTTCGGGGFNKCGSGVCHPETCASAGASCGQISDGCGHVLECGTCAQGESCIAGSCGGCVADTCASLGATCGSVSNGCGKVLQCGTCDDGIPCVNNSCTCKPDTCASLGATCGSVSDGCGKVLQCGTCDDGIPCVNNSCTCKPDTCASLGATCGSVSNGCGKVLQCGGCPPGSTCKNNTCECIPTDTCAKAKAECGVLEDGCGGVNCGACGAGESCKNHKCCSATEQCGNNVDDNCDGVVDEGCTIVCVNHCNDIDLKGDGTYCNEQYNVYNCAEDMFLEFCTRGQKQNGYDHYDAFIEAWVDKNCDGKVSGDGEYYETFSCVDSHNRTWKCQTPLALAFDGAASITYHGSAPRFELNPWDGLLAGAWPTAASPWLAVDRNNDGVVNDGSELFGSSTRLSSGRLAQHGFEALRELDTDRDGVLDCSDAGFSRLLLWRDLNADGASTRDELKTAAEEGVIAISLAYSITARCDAAGRCMREQAEVLWKTPSGALRNGAVVDLYLPSQ